jgi:hypothetical protein
MKRLVDCVRGRLAVNEFLYMYASPSAALASHPSQLSSCIQSGPLYRELEKNRIGNNQSKRARLKFKDVSLALGLFSHIR